MRTLPSYPTTGPPDKENGGLLVTSGFVWIRRTLNVDVVVATDELSQSPQGHGE